VLAPARALTDLPQIPRLTEGELRRLLDALEQEIDDR
jgi:hypothetical protein